MKQIVIIALSVICSALFSPQVNANTDNEEWPITAFPILMHEEDEDSSETDFLWPIFHHERKKSWSRFAVRPFIFSTESDPEKDYRKTSVIWPLSIYKHEGEDRSFHLFPVYWYGSYPDHRYHTLFPVYWSGEGTDYWYRHVWPPFGVYKRNDYTEYSSIFPFFRYGTDSSSGEMVLHAFWPIFNIHKKEGWFSSRLLPVYWHEKGEDSSRGFVLPYFWETKLDQRTRGAFPLWYSSSSKDTESDLVFPLYYHHMTPDREIRFITPLYSSWRTENSLFRTLLPVYYDYEKEDFGIRIGLPIYYGYQDGPIQFSSVFPFYFHSEDEERDSEFTYYFPLYGSYRRGDSVSRHLLVFPLYSSLEDRELQLSSWDVIWPLFHYERSPEHSFVRALPFYWHTQKPDSVMTIAFPLYYSSRSGENSYRHILPFYGIHQKGDWYKKRFILGPLYMDTRDTKTGVSRQDIIFPLYSRISERDRERSWLFPFYFHGERPDSNVTLGSLALLPPYYINYEKEDKHQFHIWPFYGKNQHGSYQEYSTLWPLIRFSRDSETGESVNHVLLYYNEKDQDESLTSLFPVWWHKTTTEKSLDASLFLHWYDRDDQKEKTRLSLLWLIPPKISIFGFENEPQHLSHHFFPLYGYDHDEEKDSLSWSFLWPLFQYSSNGEVARQAGFLWKVISYEQKDEEATDFRFLWRFIRRSKTATSSVFEFNPFYYRETVDEKGTKWQILGGLFGVKTTPAGERDFRFLWIF